MSSSAFIDGFSSSVTSESAWTTPSAVMSLSAGSSSNSSFVSCGTSAPEKISNDGSLAIPRKCVNAKYPVLESGQSRTELKNSVAASAKETKQIQLVV